MSMECPIGGYNLSYYLVDEFVDWVNVPDDSIFKCPFLYMNELFKIYATGAGFVAGGVLLGILLDKIVLRLIIKTVENTFSKVDDVLFHSLKGLLIFWGALGGVYLGL